MELPVLMVDPDKLQVLKQKNYWRISSLALTKIEKIVAHYHIAPGKKNSLTLRIHNYPEIS